MDYISVSQYADKFGISERTARNYCANGKIEGAFLTGKTWNIPADAALPQRKSSKKRPSLLLTVLREQKASRLAGSIYHRTQIDFTYNSNHIEGSRLTYDQTRYIFETNTIGIADMAVNVDDVVEAINHFRCIDYIIDHAEEKLTEDFIKHLHLLLKTGTSDSRKDWLASPSFSRHGRAKTSSGSVHGLTKTFSVGEYKQLPNEVGGTETCLPEHVHREMKQLLKDYHAIKAASLEDILDFHVRLERIHPFQDGNGRVGRLVMFKECLANDQVPFIITDELKLFYYRGLSEWGHINGYLTDTCLTAQDHYKALLDYFKIKYSVQRK